MSVEPTVGVPTIIALQSNLAILSHAFKPAQIADDHRCHDKDVVAVETLRSS
ncbi:MAG: hypothetical protein FWG08_00265 [Propionibacteriaceae bacterium]|nr:hypothetical protein [Propionibacteriaceae bacterium]